MGAPFGFLEFGEDDSAFNGGVNSVIKSVQCTSAAEVTAAGGSVQGGAGALFDASRGFIADGTHYLEWAAGALWASADYNKLKGQGHITLWLEKSFLDPAIVTASKGVFGLAGLSLPCLKRAGNATPEYGLAPSFHALGGALISSDYGRDSFVRVDISWTSAQGATNYSIYAETYIDKVLVNKGSSSAANANFNFSNFYIFAVPGGILTSGPGAIYRFQISTRPLFLPMARDHLDIVAFGDSITAQGGLNQNASGAFPLSHFTANTQNVPGQWADAGFVIGIRRQFAQHNLMPIIWDYGIQSTLASYFNATAIPSCYTTDRQVGFDYAVVMYGTNDAKVPTAKATYKTNMSNGINALLNTYGVKKIFLIKPPTTMHLAGQVLGTNGAATTDYGDACDELAVTYSPKVIVIDGFTATGGHADASFFVTADVHPNSKGHKAISYLLNTAIEANVDWVGA